MPLVADPLRCRSCGTADLRPFLSLGKTPLADALVDGDALEESEARFPLDVAYIDRRMTVLAVRRMRPWRLGAPRLRAHAVLEAEAGSFERWGLAAERPDQRDRAVEESLVVGRVLLAQ